MDNERDLEPDTGPLETFPREGCNIWHKKEVKPTWVWLLVTLLFIAALAFIALT